MTLLPRNPPNLDKQPFFEKGKPSTKETRGFLGLRHGQETPEFKGRVMTSAADARTFARSVLEVLRGFSEQYSPSHSSEPASVKSINPYINHQSKASIYRSLPKKTKEIHIWIP